MCEERILYKLGEQRFMTQRYHSKGNQSSGIRNWVSLSKHNLLSPQGMNPNETPHLQVLTVQNVQRVNINSGSPQVKIPISQLPNFRLLWWNGILRISPTAITVSNKTCRGKQLLASCGPEIVLESRANGTWLDYSTEHNLASNLISFKIRLGGYLGL